MPPSSRRRVPGPLANLPRPLDERAFRPRRGPGRRFVGAIVVLGLALAIIAAGSALAPRFPIGGDVAGIVAGPGPSATPTTRPTRRPSAPPTTAPPSSPPPIGNVGPPDPSTLTDYQWPLPKGRLTLPFGPSPLGSRIVDGERFHDGLDLATFCGDRVLAAHDGVVLAAGRRYDRFIGWVGDLGPYLARLDRKQLWGTLPIVVVIDDGNGYRSVYAHFSKVLVGKGDVVTAGQVIGLEGATGRATGCHVHYGLFSPDETATFAIEAGVVERMKVPPAEVARIDPLLVLPPRSAP